MIFKLGKRSEDSTTGKRNKALLKNYHSSAIADHVKNTGYNIKWDHFDISASGKTDYHCKVKETLLIRLTSVVDNIRRLWPSSQYELPTPPPSTFPLAISQWSLRVHFVSAILAMKRKR